MDEFHRVNTECLSVMLFEVQAVLLAMRGGLTTCTLEDGKDVSNLRSLDHNNAIKGGGGLKVEAGWPHG